MTPTRVGALLLVTASVAVLWLRFNAAPGELSGEARQLAIQGDLITYYLPMTEQVGGRLSRFELPLWNPHVCSGIPLLATLQTGVFHPATWLALWLPAHEALSVRMWISCWLAGVLAAWMFRAWGSSPVVSCAGGSLYVFACVLGQTLWPPAASTLALFPWSLLCVHHLLASPDKPVPWLWWCGLAAGVALQLFAGFPQYFVYGAIVVGCVAARGLARVRDLAGSGRAVFVRGLWLAAAFAAGAGIAAVQLLPSLELMRASVRSTEMTATAIHYLTIWDPYTAAEVVRAMFDPAPSLVSFHLANSAGYLGMGVLLLAAVPVLCATRRSWTWLWLGLAVVSLVLSNGMIGAGEPLYRAFAELPLIGSFRTPERLRFIAFFALIVLAVSGFEELRAAGDGASSIPVLRLRRTVMLVALGLALALLGLGERGATWRVAAVLALAMGVSWQPAGVALRRVSEFALMTVLVLDVALATGEHGSLREIPVELSNRYATGGRGRPLAPGFFEAQRDASGFDRVELVRYRPRIATSPSDGGYRISCYEPLVPAQWPRLETALHDKVGIGATLFNLSPESAAAFYDVAGVRRILRGTDAGPDVVENQDALPRAYVAASFQLASQDQAFGHLRRADFDFHSGVLLERDPGFPSPPPRPVVPARILEYAPEHVVVEANSPARALLVLSDSDYPGWRATVDGAPAEILRANGLYRAVKLSGGLQRVVFDYVPRSLQAGGVISIASLTWVVGVALASWRRRRAHGE